MDDVERTLKIDFPQSIEYRSALIDQARQADLASRFEDKLDLIDQATLSRRPMRPFIEPAVRSGWMASNRLLRSILLTSFRIGVT